MTSAKVEIREQDRSSIVPAIKGINCGIVVVSNKGDVDKPRLISSESDLIDRYGIPNPKLGTSMYSAINYLKKGNKLWVTRAAATNARYSASLVRSKVDEIPANPLDAVTSNMLVVNPIGGLTQANRDSYSFPVYPTNKLFGLEANVDVLDARKWVDEIILNSLGTLTVGTKIAITPELIGNLNNPLNSVGENTPIYTIVNSGVRQVVYAEVTIEPCDDPGNNIGSVVTNPWTVVKTALIKNIPNIASPNVTVNYTDLPRLARNANLQGNTVLVTSADFIQVGDKIKLAGANFSVVSKRAYVENQSFIKLDRVLSVFTNYPTNYTTVNRIYRITQDQFEPRDAFLVTSINPGVWGNKISIAITASKTVPTGFVIIVYYDGVKVESWEVTREERLDGFQRQLQLEEKINGKSAYIWVKNNVANVNNAGVFNKPLVTDYSIWRQNSTEVFIPYHGVSTTGEGSFDIYINTNETIIKGDRVITLNSEWFTDGNGDDVNLHDLVQAGNRIKFELGDGKLSSEYIVQSLSTLNNGGSGTIFTVTLNRSIVETQISTQFDHDVSDANGNDDTVPFDTRVYFFDNTYDLSAQNIFQGIKRYKATKLPKVYYNYPLNAAFTIGGVAGVLHSAGANLANGGSLGSTASLSDLIRAVNKYSNKEVTPVTLFMDGGFAIPAYAQAINDIMDLQGLSHAYYSVPFEAESGYNYLEDIVNYKNSLMLDTHRGSVYSGWVKQFDEYNQLYVWTSPEAYAAASQSHTTTNYNIFTPAAGWIRGKIVGLDVRVRFSEPDRDFLVDNQVNPIRYKEGSGLVVWGNETLLSRPSPLQLRSVAMLIIAIKYGLENMLEYKNFDFNDERTWSIVEGSIDGFMRDEFKSKGGVYDYVVAVEDVVTNSDIDNRKMPVFLGIQPTMDIQLIPVTLAIFNKSVDIEVSV